MNIGQQNRERMYDELIRKTLAATLSCAFCHRDIDVAVIDNRKMSPNIFCVDCAWHMGVIGKEAKE